MENSGSSSPNFGYYDMGEGANDYSSMSDDEFSSLTEEEEQEQEQEQEQELEEEEDEDVVMADLLGPQLMGGGEPPFKVDRWKTVEVVASFDPNEMQAGGGFLLRDYHGVVALVEAFPVSGNCPLNIEAFVLRNVMQKIISFGEQRVMFIIDSNCLYNMLTATEPPWISISADSMTLNSIIRDCIEFQRTYEFMFLRRRRTDLAAAEWLADCGMRCQQHCRWDIHRPWPPQLVALVLGSTVPRRGRRI